MKGLLLEQMTKGSLIWNQYNSELITRWTEYRWCKREWMRKASECPRERERERESTKVKCLGILSTDFTTPIIGSTQQIPIGEITFNWFLQNQSPLWIPVLFLDQCCLLQHHFIDPLLWGSWRVSNCTGQRCKADPRAESKPPLCSSTSACEAQQGDGVLFGSKTHPKKNTRHLRNLSICCCFWLQLWMTQQGRWGDKNE